MVVAGLAALCALPALVGAVPVSGSSDLSLLALLAKVRASDSVGYSGYAESRGTLGLPKIPRLSGIDDLLSGTTQMRVWYAGPTRFRVDEIGLIGETDTYVGDGGSWRWESDERRATLIVGLQPVRLPRGGDLLPADLGRRLAAAARPSELHRLPPRRIAGRTALGVRIVPRDPATTVGRVDLWVDRSTGLPLRVEVSGRAAAPTLITSYLDLRIGRPALRLTEFHPPADASIDTTAAPDLAAAVDRYAPYVLPPAIAGLPRRARVAGVGGSGGTATYGDRYTLLTVLPLPSGIGSSILESLKGPPARLLTIAGAPAAALPTPLVNALVLSADSGYFLLAGSVRLPILERAAAQLVATPPPYRPVAP